MSAGWLAGMRKETDGPDYSPSSWWMRLLSMMSIVPGIILVCWVAQQWPAEKKALQLENAILTEDFSRLSDIVASDPEAASDNPRYLALVAEAAWIESIRAQSLLEQTKWRRRCLEAWQKCLAVDPWNAEALRGYGYVQASRGDLPQSLAFLLRAIAMDPNSATGHESLADYFLFVAGYLYRDERYDEAKRSVGLSARLLRLSRTLPNASAPPEKLAEIESYLRSSGP
jgi:tetratricopeptide (TPR) repeat protein